MVYVKCNSHRAREKLFKELSYEPQSYASFKRDTGKGVYKIQEQDLITVINITGITKFKPGTDLGPTWG